MSAKGRNPRTKAVCEECAQPLEVHTCPTCTGDGTVRSWGLFSRRCDLCGGEGQIARCPNITSHRRVRRSRMLERLSTAPGHRDASLIRNWQFLGRKICSMCFGQGTIAEFKQIPNPKPHERAIPGRGKITTSFQKRCPTCDGQGWLPKPETPAKFNLPGQTGRPAD